MGVRKTDLYTKEENRRALLARAVGAEPRNVILRLLHEHHALTIADFQLILKLSKPTIQQHINVLIQTGLIRGYFLDRKFVWSLNPAYYHELFHLRWIIFSQN